MLHAVGIGRGRAVPMLILLVGMVECSATFACLGRHSTQYAVDRLLNSSACAPSHRCPALCVIDYRFEQADNHAIAP